MTEQNVRCTIPPDDLRVGTGSTESISFTIAERGKQYGDYGQMSYIAQRIKDTMREGSSWENMGPEKRESLEMIATKIARLVCGNSDFKDSWHDIAGYATKAEERCPLAPALVFDSTPIRRDFIGADESYGGPATP